MCKFLLMMSTSVSARLRSQSMRKSMTALSHWENRNELQAVRNSLRNFCDSPATQAAGALQITAHWSSKRRMSLRLSSVDPQRLAVRILLAASAAVCALAALSLTAADPTTAQFFDRLHWTVAYVTAAVMAWLGRAGKSKVPIARRGAGSRSASRSLRSRISITSPGLSPVACWCPSSATSCISLSVLAA